MGPEGTVLQERPSRGRRAQPGHGPRFPAAAAAPEAQPGLVSPGWAHGGAKRERERERDKKRERERERGYIYIYTNRHMYI